MLLPKLHGRYAHLGDKWYPKLQIKIFKKAARVSLCFYSKLQFPRTLPGT